MLVRTHYIITKETVAKDTRIDKILLKAPLKDKLEIFRAITILNPGLPLGLIEDESLLTQHHPSLQIHDRQLPAFKYGQVTLSWHLIRLPRLHHAGECSLSQEEGSSGTWGTDQKGILQEECRLQQRWDQNGRG